MFAGCHARRALKAVSAAVQCREQCRVQRIEKCGSTARLRADIAQSGMQTIRFLSFVRSLLSLCSFIVHLVFAVRARRFTISTIAGELAGRSGRCRPMKRAPARQKQSLLGLPQRIALTMTSTTMKALRMKISSRSTTITMTRTKLQPARDSMPTALGPPCSACTLQWLRFKCVRLCVNVEMCLFSLA